MTTFDENLVLMSREQGLECVLEAKSPLVRVDRDSSYEVGTSQVVNVPKLVEIESVVKRTEYIVVHVDFH